MGGWEADLNRPRRRALAALKVVVDVQHLYRTGLHARDRGAIFTLPDRTRVAEASLATSYAFALCETLSTAGASVLTNDPLRSILVGPYSARHTAAMAWKANLYLACHVNAGGGRYARLVGLAESPAALLAATPAGQIGKQLTDTFPGTIRSADPHPLVAGDRGAVCVRGILPPAAALILEPFFGDTPIHQALFAPAQLVALGRAIGRGVIEWWVAR